MSTQEPREISPEEIRAGDHLRVEYDDGDLIRGFEGRADRRDICQRWLVRDERWIYNPDKPPSRIVLLHRPAPAEPKGLGAVVRARVPASGGRLLTFVQVRVEQGLAPWQGPGLSRFYWSDFYPESIEVLSEGIEVEQ